MSDRGVVAVDGAFSVGTIDANVRRLKIRTISFMNNRGPAIMIDTHRAAATFMADAVMQEQFDLTTECVFAPSTEKFAGS